MKENLKIIIGSIILILFCSIFFYKCGSSVSKTNAENKNNQNIAALTAELQTYKNSLNEITKSRASLAVEKEQLEKINNELGLRVRYAENKVLVLNKLNIDFEKKYSDLNDSYNSVCELCEIDKEKLRSGFYNGILNDSLSAFAIAWNLYNKKTENELHFDILGETSFNGRIDTIQKKDGQDSFKITILNASTSLKSLKIGLKVFSGIEYDEKQKLYKSTVTCADTNIKLDVNGWIDPEIFYKEKKKWHLGPYVGVGVGIPLNSGTTVQFPNISVGFGITYSIIEF